MHINNMFFFIKINGIMYKIIIIITYSTIYGSNEIIKKKILNYK